MEVSQSRRSEIQRFGLRVFGGADRGRSPRNGKVDVVVMLDVIEHLTDPMATLGLAYSALNPGGVMLIVTATMGPCLAR